MYGLDRLSSSEYKMLCAYEKFQEEAVTFLEDYGKTGKLYLAALRENFSNFEDLYKNYLMDMVDSDEE